MCVSFGKIPWCTEYVILLYIHEKTMYLDRNRNFFYREHPLFCWHQFALICHDLGQICVWLIVIVSIRSVYHVCHCQRVLVKVLFSRRRHASKLRHTNMERPSFKAKHLVMMQRLRTNINIYTKSFLHINNYKYINVGLKSDNTSFVQEVGNFLRDFDISYVYDCPPPPSASYTCSFGLDWNSLWNFNAILRVLWKVFLWYISLISGQVKYIHTSIVVPGLLFFDCLTDFYYMIFNIGLSPEKNFSWSCLPNSNIL